MKHLDKDTVKDRVLDDFAKSELNPLGSAVSDCILKLIHFSTFWGLAVPNDYYQTAELDHLKHVLILMRKAAELAIKSIDDLIIESEYVNYKCDCNKTPHSKDCILADYALDK